MVAELPLGAVREAGRRHGGGVGGSDGHFILERDVNLAELVARSNFEPVELMDGKDAEGLQQTLLALFRKYDTEGKGHLSPDQFTECLANTSLGLSAADVDVLLDMADADEDDQILIVLRREGDGGAGGGGAAAADDT